MNGEYHMNERQFRTIPAPFVAAIVQEESAESAMANILNSEHDGAKGFAIDFSFMKESDRSEEQLRKIFGISARPMMPLFYRYGYLASDKLSEDRRAEAILSTMQAGAASIDVMGDMFEPFAKFELARSERAISAQKDLIRRIHERGGEVLMSSHMPEPRSAEQVLEHMQTQIERGADITKVITTCDTEQEFMESVRTLLLLKEKMDRPFIFLCNGKYGRIQRCIAPTLGCMLSFAIERFRPHSLGAQFNVSAASMILKEMTWHKII